MSTACPRWRLAPGQSSHIFTENSLTCLMTLLMHAAGVLHGLQSSNWKERLTSMEALQQQVRDQKENLEGANSILIQGMSFVPGWTEKNFQVVKQTLLAAALLSRPLARAASIPSSCVMCSMMHSLQNCCPKISPSQLCQLLLSCLVIACVLHVTQ